MNIIHVRGVIVVADGVFPEAPLPDTAFAVADASVGAPLAGGQAAGEDRLDHPPPCREIVVAGRQRPNAVEMIGKHHPGIDDERAALTYCPHRLPQPVDVSRQQIVASPLHQIDREEVTLTGYAMATIVGNGCVLRFDVPRLP